MLVASYPRTHSQKHVEHLRPLETRLQIVLECGSCILFPRWGTPEKCEDHGRTTTGHPTQSAAIVQYAGECENYAEVRQRYTGSLVRSLVGFKSAASKYTDERLLVDIEAKLQIKTIAVCSSRLHVDSSFSVCEVLPQYIGL